MKPHDGVAAPKRADTSCIRNVPATTFAMNP